MGRLLLFLLIYGVLAVPANAADLGELTPLSVHGSEDCGGPSGAPGELVVRTTTGVRFVTATRAGFQPGQTLTLGKGFTCSAVKVRPSGAGVIVGQLDGRVVAVVRDPGGAWSAPLTVVPITETSPTLSVTADVSDRGDVIVAMKAFTIDDKDLNAPPRSRFLAARRAPGGTFGAGEQLGAAAVALGDIEVGIAATGEAFVVTTLAPKNHQPPFQVPVEVRLALPGGTFGAPVHVADTRLLLRPGARGGRRRSRAHRRGLRGTRSSSPSARRDGLRRRDAGRLGRRGRVHLAVGRIAPGGAAAVVMGAAAARRSADRHPLPPPARSHHRSSHPTPSGVASRLDPFYSPRASSADQPDRVLHLRPLDPLTLTPDGRAVLAIGEGTRHDDDDRAAGRRAVVHRELPATGFDDVRRRVRAGARRRHARGHMDASRAAASRACHGPRAL